jgi:hypothetical protein
MRHVRRELPGAKLRLALAASGPASLEYLRTLSASLQDLICSCSFKALLTWV